MKKLHLLFTKDGLQSQISKGKKILEENEAFLSEDDPKDLIQQTLTDVLGKEYFEISVVVALNHFALSPIGFDQHDLGSKLISYNAPIDTVNEKIMLSINKQYGIQFYYSLPKIYYTEIKNQGKTVHFNFSGEKFLNSIQSKNQKEIHINLYHEQCEFFALENKKVLLYNNLDITSEVDFLYFIMFTLSKIGFGIDDTFFFVYGETTVNDTFISELRKFVKHLKIVFDNIPQENFILN